MQSPKYSEMEQLWLANEAFDTLQDQKARQAPFSTDAVEQFQTNSDIYNIVGKRILAGLVEAAPDYKTALFVAVRKTLYESRPGEDETEDAIAWRSLTKLTDALKSPDERADLPRQTLAIVENPSSVKPRKIPSAKELEEARTCSDEELAALWRQGDQTAATIIQERYYRLTDMKARILSRTRFSRVHDLKGAQQEGLVAFLERTKDWEPAKGAKLSSFAGKGAEWAIQRWLAVENHLVRVPAAAKMISELAGVNNERLHDGNPPMSPAEIAEHFDIPLDGPNSIISVRILNQAVRLTRFMDSLDTDLISNAPDRPQSETNAGPTGDTLSLVTDELPKDPADEAVASMQGRAIKKAMRTLRPQRREVLSLHYGLNGDSPMLLPEIARLYGVTPQNISLHHIHGLKDLRKIGSQSELRDFIE